MAKSNNGRPLLNAKTARGQADTLEENEQQAQAGRCTGSWCMSLRNTITKAVYCHNPNSRQSSNQILIASHPASGIGLTFSLTVQPKLLKFSLESGDNC